MYNLPNILTISRIVVIPVIFLSVYIHSTWWSALAAVLFVFAAITDYFDGYFARTRNQVSVFGRLLDPIADKLLVVSALLIIVANKMVHPVSYIPVMVILCREVLVSGLREFLANVKIGMPVTKLAKWKTGFQMTSLAIILFKGVPVLGALYPLGESLLWVAGILTFITGYEYFQKSLDYVKSLDKKDTAKAKVETIKTEVKKTAVKVSPKKPAKKAAVKVAATAKAKETVQKSAEKAPAKKAVKKAVKKPVSDAKKVAKPKAKTKTAKKTAAKK